MMRFSSFDFSMRSHDPENPAFLASTLQMRGVFVAVFVVICILWFQTIGYCAQQENVGFTFSRKTDYWPTEGWKHSVPEAQGMSSWPLYSMFREINRENYYISSVTVIRNGYIVVEANRNAPDHLLPIWKFRHGDERFYN